MQKRRSLSDRIALQAAAPRGTPGDFKRGDETQNGIGIYAPAAIAVFGNRFESLSDVLMQAMISKGCTTNTGSDEGLNASFLSEMGIESLTAGQWQAMLDKKAVPGKRLSNVLALMFSGAFPNYCGEDFFIAPRDFHVHASSARMALPEKEKIEVEISNDEFQQIRLRLLSKALVETQVDEKHAGGGALNFNVADLERMAHERGLFHATASDIQKAIDANPSLLAFLREHDADVAPVHSNSTGRTLYCLRQLKGISQDALAARIGVSQGTIKNWEKGFKPDNPAKLHLLYEALDIPLQIAEELVPMINPDVSKSDVQRFLKQGKSGAVHLSFPSFDHDWLAAQPKKAQAGLLIRDLRMHAGIKQDALAQRLGIADSVLCRWEDGTYQVIPHKLHLLHRHLNIAPEMMARLAPLVNEAISPEDVTRWLSAKPPQTEYLSFPAFDPQWLQQQPPRHQAGMMLSQMRHRAGMTQQELADSLGLSKGMIAGFEEGKFTISQGEKAGTINRCSQIVQVLRDYPNPTETTQWLGDDMAQQFKAAIETSYPHIRQFINETRRSKIAMRSGEAAEMGAILLPREQPHDLQPVLKHTMHTLR